ncbi:MAG: sulfate ABC transporter substrate-binding protein, partial [Mesorhizobium sp.]
MKRFLLGVATLAGLFLASSQAWSSDRLLNASYDVGRELFAQVNKAFIAEHPGAAIDQSHAGTSAQARAIAEGLGADVVTF